MIVVDIMTHPTLAIDPQAPLLQAIRLMTAHRVSGLPVFDPQGCVLGILTEGDLLRRADTGTAGELPGWLASFLQPGRSARQYVATHARRVGELMTTEVIAVTEDTALEDAVELMQRHRVRRLPVVRDGRPLGVVSRADLVRLLGEKPKIAVSVVRIRPWHRIFQRLVGKYDFFWHCFGTGEWFG